MSLVRPPLAPRLSRDTVLALAFALLTAVLAWLPTGPPAAQGEGRPALVLAVDDTQVQRMGLMTVGEQRLTLRLLSGPQRGLELEAVNPLLGQMERDKLFAPGDTAHVVLTKDQAGRVVFAHPQDHYRLDLELVLLGLLAALLVAFAGWTGVRALLSFVFAGVVLWKVLVPLLLRGVDPVWATLGVTTLLSAAIIFLVAGLTRTGLAAFCGTMLGVGTACALALYFTARFHMNGAVLPFSETLLYAGYQHLDLARIYAAGVFLSASGAVMDLAMDVAASMGELAAKRPDMGRGELLRSGLRVGRAVVGTMTTTLLLAYCGGAVTLLMAFMAQGVPLATTSNLVFVAAEVLRTLAGSFGLVAVAPFTALCGAVIFAPRHPPARPVG
ncbi:YibE/F family protein [Desulfocurvus vexinensis]|uniref:YibE/F family protein n=1 Tax=Desulfocurvus vexinensis TaxID=399548 RepID=UPI0004AD600B|nr:YibE/F family protein [Desulfocurvus vexinensis]